MADTVLVIFYILTTILVACFGCFLCACAYLHYLHSITAHIPGPPRSSFILGSLPDYWKYKAATGRTIGEYLVEKRFEYGPIFIVFFMQRAIVFLGDSSYLRHVFINNHKNLCKGDFFYHKLGFIYGERASGYGLVANTDEALWRKRRQLIEPAFHRKCLRGFMSNFNNVCDRFLTRIGIVVDGEKPTSMVSEFSKVTLEAISQVAFNINTHAIEHPDSPFPQAIQISLMAVQDNMNMPLNSTMLAIYQLKLFQNATKKKQLDAVRFLRKFARDCVTARKKDMADSKAVPDDLLSLLVNSSLSMDDIADEFLTVFVGGQQTTADSLSFTLYEIISNPHVEAKILQEVNEVLGERDYVEFDDLAKLKYLGQVLEESLRKHPIAAAPSRQLVKGLMVGGYYIPKGIGINSLQLFFSMNPEIWKNPEVFDPERFANVKNIPNFTMTHFPFSIGPHNCVGQTFAKFESKVILAKLLQKFRFTLLPGQTDRMEARLTLTPRDGVMCHVTRRK